MDTWSNRNFTDDEKQFINQFEASGIVTTEYENIAMLTQKGLSQDPHRVTIFAVGDEQYLVFPVSGANVYSTSDLEDALKVATEIFIHSER